MALEIKQDLVIGSIFGDQLIAKKEVNSGKFTPVQIVPASRTQNGYVGYVIRGGEVLKADGYATRVAGFVDADGTAMLQGVIAPAGLAEPANCKFDDIEFSYVESIDQVDGSKSNTRIWQKKTDIQAAALKKAVVDGNTPTGTKGTDTALTTGTTTVRSAFTTVTDWVTANPWLAGAILVGAFILYKEFFGKKSKGKKSKPFLGLF